MKVTFQEFQKTVSPGVISRALKSSDTNLDTTRRAKQIIPQSEDQYIKTTTTSQKKTEGGKGGGGGGGGGKLDKLPEYLR